MLGSPSPWKNRAKVRSLRIKHSTIAAAPFTHAISQVADSVDALVNNPKVDLAELYYVYAQDVAQDTQGAATFAQAVRLHRLLDAAKGASE